MKNKSSLTLKIGFEFAYEIIINSFLIIFVGLAFLFASNLLSLNWISVLFAGLAVLLFYLKKSSCLEIENDVLSIVYLKAYKHRNIQMITIDEFIFYEKSRLVEVKSNGQVIGRIYMKNKKKQILLDYLINQYPNIPCIHTNQIN